MSSQPTVRAVRHSGLAVELDLHLPRSLDWFVDHFPRLAILPGVVQIDWAICFGRQHLQIPGVFRGLRGLKFVNPVLPETALTLVLEARKGELAFAYRAGERAFSSGRVLFA